jgi:hypothetical protein
VLKRNIIKLIEPGNVEDQLTGVPGALAAVRSARRFQEEKSVLFTATKTEWKILDEAIAS